MSRDGTLGSDAVGSGRSRLFGAFFLALGIALLLPAIVCGALLIQGASLAIVAPLEPIVLIVSTIGGLAASVGGLRSLLGMK
ncbi:MAG: hypothetical protein AB7H66_15885 [Hyphomonadaceae bacterium]